MCWRKRDSLTHVSKLGAGSPRCHLWSPVSTTPPLAVSTVPKSNTARQKILHPTQAKFPRAYEIEFYNLYLNYTAQIIVKNENKLIRLIYFRS